MLVVESARSALSTFLWVGFSWPFAEPDVPVSEHPALHGFMRRARHWPIGAARPGSPVPHRGCCALAMVRWYSPATSWHSSSGTANSLPSFPMCTAFPCPEYYEGSAPSRCHQSTTDLPASSPAGWREGNTVTVPTFTICRLTRLVSNYAPVASPHLRRRHSEWPPARPLRTGSESTTTPVVAVVHY